MGKRRLGRGLDALLGRSLDGLPESGEDGGDLGHIPLDAIEQNPYQPRHDFDADEMASLIESVMRHGVVQPIVVRPVDGRFQLVAGQRRLRAAREAGLAEVPARVVELEDRQVFEVAIVENLQRQDLNPIEKARAFQEYLDQFGATQEELSQRIGIDRSTVSNFVRLLELPDEVCVEVRGGRISAGHARALLTLDDPVRQRELCRRIVAERLSVRDVEDAVGGGLPEPSEPAAGVSVSRSPAAKTSHVLSLEQQLREALGTRVEIKLRGRDRGRLVIHFHSNDEFERIKDQLCPSPGAVA